MILVYATYKIGQQTPKYVKLSPTNESKTFNNSERERERERERARLSRYDCAVWGFGWPTLNEGGSGGKGETTKLDMLPILLLRLFLVSSFNLSLENSSSVIPAQDAFHISLMI